MDSELKKEIARIRAICESVELPPAIIEAEKKATAAGEELAAISAQVMQHRASLSGRHNTEEVGRMLASFEQQFAKRRDELKAIRAEVRETRDTLIAKYSPAYREKMAIAERDAATLLHDLLDALDEASSAFAHANRAMTAHRMEPTPLMRAALLISGMVKAARESLGPRAAE